jgi:hypothetical protein
MRGSVGASVRGIGRALCGGRVEIIGDLGVGGLFDSGPGIGPGTSRVKEDPSPAIIGGGVSSRSSGGGRALGSTTSAAPGRCRAAIDAP